MKKIYYTFILFLFALNLFSQKKALKTHVDHVSIIDLISNGEKFNDNQFYVKGYFVDYGRHGRL
ncbi:hypothetical protein, partial [Flavobacterium sp. 9AF]|uniref:hypothetical protein n=1 Tax=Flavobacterium sp. 9AF TaxID=2653142 RepID=UPI001358215A